MAALTIQTMTASGLAPTTVSAAGGGDTVAVSSGDDRTFLYINNGGGSPITVTLTDPGKTPAGSSATNPTVTVTNGTFKFIPLSPNLIDASTGLVSVGYSAVTTVTVAAVRR